MAVASLSGLDERDIADVLAAGARVGPALRGARILVTGATGWFGTWLLDALVALDAAGSLGLTIVAVSRNPAAFRRMHPALYAAPTIEWMECDVRDSMIEAPGPFTHIIHAATETSAKSDKDSLDHSFETIFCGTLSALKLAACHPSVKVLLVSSGAVYGPQRDDVARMAEDHRGAPDQLDPANAYAEGKRAAEMLGAIWHASHGVHVTIARCFAFVGPHMPFGAHFAIGNFIRDATSDGEIVVRGDGTPRRSYQYMSDLVVWLLTILVAGRPMRPYNVGGDEVVTIAALARKCADAGASRAGVRIASLSSSGTDYVADVSRACGELGLSNRVSLDDAIRRTQAWLRASPAGPGRTGQATAAGAGR